MPLIEEMIAEGILEPTSGHGENRKLHYGSVRRVDSVIRIQRDLGVNLNPARADTPPRNLQDSADEEALLRALQQGPRPADLVARETGLIPAKFAAALFSLTERGRLRVMPGDLLAIVRTDG